MSIRPYGSKVLVEPIEFEKTKSNLVVNGTTSDNSKFSKGVVLDIGDPIPNIAGVMIEPKIKKGEFVIYNKYNAIPVSHEGKNYLIIPYHEILAVLSTDTDINIVKSGELLDRKDLDSSFKG